MEFPRKSRDKSSNALESIVRSKESRKEGRGGATRFTNTTPSNAIKEVKWCLSRN